MKFVLTRTSSRRADCPLPKEVRERFVVEQEDEDWTIRIDTLEQLLELERLTEWLVVSTFGDKHYLEIYDDYRE